MPALAKELSAVEVKRLRRTTAVGGVRGLTRILPKGFPEKVFLTFDIDALDSSLMPATGTPEPGGLFWWEALLLIRLSLAGRTLIGFDVVELAPIPGMHAPTFAAARLVYEIMGEIGRARGERP